MKRRPSTKLKRASTINKYKNEYLEAIRLYDKYITEQRDFYLNATK